ncbi:hypothetical protein JHW43_001171 [Diplocarpon mali]|nr:hypothetical protein JHW43_001171 [Diplocarpon mali]
MCNLEPPSPMTDEEGRYTPEHETKDKKEASLEPLDVKTFVAEHQKEFRRLRSKRKCCWFYASRCWGCTSHRPEIEERQPLGLEQARAKAAVGAGAEQHTRFCVAERADTAAVLDEKQPRRRRHHTPTEKLARDEERGERSQRQLLVRRKHANRAAVAENRKRVRADMPTWLYRAGFPPPPSPRASS